MSRIFIAFALILLILSGCATQKPRRMPVTPQPMVCNDKPAQITLFSPEEAKLVFEEKSYNLKRGATTSGIKYGNSDISYWNKGIDAMITRADGSIATCTYIPKKGL